MAKDLFASLSVSVRNILRVMLFFQWNRSVNSLCNCQLEYNIRRSSGKTRYIFIVYQFSAHFPFVITYAMGQRLDLWKSRSALRRRHNKGNGVSNHRRLNLLLNILFRHKLKKTSKVRVIGLCEANSSVTGEFPAQWASNAENVSIWWRHHGNDSLAAAVE